MSGEGGGRSGAGPGISDPWSVGRGEGPAAEPTDAASWKGVG